MKKFAALIVLTMLSISVMADVFRPAFLELREAGNDSYDVLWKVPAAGDTGRLAAYVNFPADTQYLSEPRVVVLDGAWTEYYRIQRSGGVVG